MKATISENKAAYLKRVRLLQEAEARGEKISLLERARRIGPVLTLVPGFSFDSDSRIKLYD